MDKTQNRDTQLKQKVVTLLTRQQIDFLDKIGKDMLFFGGRKLSRGKIISILVDILLEHKDGIDTKRVKNSMELKEKVLQAIKKTQPRNEFPTPYEIFTVKEEHNKEESSKSQLNKNQEAGR